MKMNESQEDPEAPNRERLKPTDWQASFHKVSGVKGRRTREILRAWVRHEHHFRRKIAGVCRAGFGNLT